MLKIVVVIGLVIRSFWTENKWKHKHGWGSGGDRDILFVNRMRFVPLTYASLALLVFSGWCCLFWTFCTHWFTLFQSEDLRAELPAPKQRLQLCRGKRWSPKSCRFKWPKREMLQLEPRGTEGRAFFVTVQSAHLHLDHGLNLSIILLKYMWHHLMWRDATLWVLSI